MRILLTALFLFGCAPNEEHPSVPEQEPAPTPAAMPTPSPTEAPARECLETFIVDSHRSVLREQRERSGAKRWDDFPKVYAAAYLDPETQQPVEIVKSIQVGKTPLLWFTPDFGDVVVNAAVLTDLALVDAPKLGDGERVEIGALTELGLGRLSGRDLLRFVIAADVVRTYWHIGSTVCLLEERDDADGYRAKLSGEHVYFTNAENRDAFGMVVERDPAGRIAVVGSKAVPFTTESTPRED